MPFNSIHLQDVVHAMFFHGLCVLCACGACIFRFGSTLQCVLCVCVCVVCMHVPISSIVAVCIHLWYPMSLYALWVELVCECL